MVRDRLGSGLSADDGPSHLPRRFRERRQRAAQEAADERAYREYKQELDSIRAKYDADREPDAMSEAYEAEIAALHDKYQDMLGESFGLR